MIRWWLVVASVAGLVAGCSLEWGASEEFVITVTPAPSEVCGAGWPGFGEWREGVIHEPGYGCGAGGTRLQCTRDGIIEVEWQGENTDCLTVTAAAVIATPDPEGVCGEGWEFGEKRDSYEWSEEGSMALAATVISGGGSCGIGGARQWCTNEGLMGVEWDGVDEVCLTAVAESALPATATATPVIATANHVASPTPPAEEVCGVGWEYNEKRDERSPEVSEGCGFGSTRTLTWCNSDGLMSIEMDGTDANCVAATAARGAAMVVSTATATSVSPTVTPTPDPEEICGEGWSAFGERKDGGKRYRRDGETGKWVLESYSVWECDQIGLKEIETLLD